MHALELFLQNWRISLAFSDTASNSVSKLTFLVVCSGRQADFLVLL